MHTLHRQVSAPHGGAITCKGWPQEAALRMFRDGSVGVGYSVHAGMVVVADGTREADQKLERVLTCDPGLGVVRHADAGYPEAAAAAARAHIDMPMGTPGGLRR